MTTTDLGQCTKQVSDRQRWPNFHACKRKAQTIEDGKGYCAQHVPATVKIKNQERYDKYTRKQNVHWTNVAYQQAAARWCRKRGMTLEELKG